MADGGRRDSYNAGWCRAVEVTKTVPPVEVFEVTVRDVSTSSPRNFAMYRAERLESLYPGQPTPTFQRRRP